MKPMVMFAIVIERCQKGQAQIEVMCDISKSEFVQKAEIDLTYIKMHCYVVESLSTTVREFKTMRMVEFYGLSNIIFNP